MRSTINSAAMAMRYTLPSYHLCSCLATLSEMHIFSSGAALPGLRTGIGLIPEDRKAQGTVLGLSIKENIVYSVLHRINKLGVVQTHQEKELVDSYVDKLSIKTPSVTQLVAKLSGGNQQKVVLARALATHPKVLILNGPTVGVDIGAKYDIHNLLKQLASEGVAVIVVSDDTAEVISTCDRALVMQGGQITGELAKEDLNAQNLADAAG